MSRLRAARELARCHPPPLPSPLCTVLYYPVNPRSLCCRAGGRAAARPAFYMVRELHQGISKVLERVANGATLKDAGKCLVPRGGARDLRVRRYSLTVLPTSSALLSSRAAGVRLAAARVPSASQRSNPPPWSIGVSSPRTAAT